MLARSKKCTADGRKLPAAQGRGHGQRIIEDGSMAHKGGFNGGAFAFEPLIINAGSAADPARGAAAEQRRAQRRRRGRVSDSHLPDGKEMAIRRNGAISYLDRGEKRVDLHCRCFGKVDRGAIEIDGHDQQHRSGDLRNLVDRGSSGIEVRDHLRRDGLRIGGNPARSDAMIAGEYRDDRPIENGHLTALPLGHPGRQLFEAA